MLREFPMNIDPAASYAYESLFALSCLNYPSLTLFVHVHTLGRVNLIDDLSLS